MATLKRLCTESWPPAPDRTGHPCLKAAVLDKAISRAIQAMAILIPVMVLPAACTTGKAVHPPASIIPQADPAAFEAIKSSLDKGAATIDYDTLMQIHGIMSQTRQPIVHADQLLRELIRKRNADPRVDQMILIFAARIIGGSRYAIPDAQGVLETILEQNGRVNEWVISFVAEAVENYPYDLPQGDRLMDLLESRLAQVRSVDRSQEEFFGYHFLPPPKSEFIRAYIDGIGEREIRQRERNLYYTLISGGLTEIQIETALQFLQAHGAPDDGESCARLVQCLARYRDRLPFYEKP